MKMFARAFIFIFSTLPIMFSVPYASNAQVVANYLLLSPYGIFTLLCSYLLLVRLLRFRKFHHFQSKYASLLKDPYSMSYQNAHEIAKLHMLDEQLFLHAFATQWALIKTYAIASGTKPLVGTRQLSTPERVGRRTEDTAVLLFEMLAGDMDSDRWMTAMAKVNWLHSKYQKHIKNDDMLHTLSLFIMEPITWIDRYGWRPLSELERVARFVFWKEIGRRMGIQDIPQSIEDLQEWVEEYEKHAMVYAESNKMCADTTMDLFLRNVPSWAHGAMKNMARSFMEDKVLQAVGWPRAPRWINFLDDIFFKVRGQVIRYLFLPRYSPLELFEPSEDGRIYRGFYGFEPWYMKQGVWTRIKTWFGSAGRLHVGGEFGSQGYRPEEVGPPEFVKVSRKPVLAQVEAMQEYVKSSNGAGCPFLFGGELDWKRSE
jgi:hypothetical protein